MATLVCKSEELARGQKVACRVGPVPVVVIRVRSGKLFALVDRCLHQGAALSDGRLVWENKSSGVGNYRMTRETEVLRCPRHAYDYDVTSGCILIQPDRVLQRFIVWEDNEGIWVELKPASTPEVVPANVNQQAR